MLSIVAYRTVQRKTETGVSTIISLFNSVEAGQCGVEVKHVSIITTKQRSQHSNWATVWTRWGLNLDRVRRLFSSPYPHTGSTAQPATHSMATGITSLGTKPKGREINISLQPSVEVKNVLPLMPSCRWRGQLFVFIIFINRSAYEIIIKQDKQCTYNVILWHFRVTIVGVETQQCILCVCVCCWATCHCELYHNMSVLQQSFYGKFMLPTHIKRWVSMYSSRCCIDVKRMHVR
jgi:hypothetical protein